MRAHVEAARGRSFDCPAGAVEVMAAPDVRERLVIAGLDAVFDLDYRGAEGLFLASHGLVAEFFQQVKPGIVDAVWARPDDEPDHTGVLQGFAIDLPQPFNCAIGVAEGLEIGKIVRRAAISDLMERDTLVKLLRDGLARSAVARVEGGVVAVRTAARPHRSVPVGTGETGIDHKFLQPFAIFRAEIVRV